MSRTYARAPREERAIGKVPHTQGNQVTIIGVIGLDGIQNEDKFFGAMNKFKMVDYIENNLSKNWNEDDIFVMDGLTAHKAKIVITAFDKFKIKYILLPPYDPNLNPIELFWSMFKSILKSIEARTNLDLFVAIDEAFRQLQDIDVRKLFKKCGYFLLDIVKNRKNIFDWFELLNPLTYKLNAS